MAATPLIKAPVKALFPAPIMALVAALGLAAAAAPLGAQPSQQQEDDRDTRTELQEARRALEEAAREVARLSAQAAGPVVRNFTFIARPAVLGITISDDENGVAVDGVTPGGPADESGLRTGDVIVAMDGAALGGDEPAALLVAQMGNVTPGDAVVLTIVRDGDEEEIEIVAGSSAAFSGSGEFGDRRFFEPGEWFRGRGDVPEWAGGRDGPYAGTDWLRDRGGDIAARLLSFRRSWADMELVELTPELGEYFGTETGILVIRAPSGETLDALMDGDVILDIGGRTPNSTEHALRILASFEPGEALELTIMRQRRRQTLEVEFP